MSNSKSLNGQKFKITCPGTYPDKISVIKSIRALTGSGLYNAKLVSENNITHELEINFPDFPKHPRTYVTITPIEAYYANVRILKENGVKIVPPISILIDKLTEIKDYVSDYGDEILKTDLQELILTLKLRHG